VPEDIILRKILLTEVAQICDELIAAIASEAAEHSNRIHRRDFTSVTRDALHDQSLLSQFYDAIEAVEEDNPTQVVVFVLGEADYRTPQDSGGEQLFRALKYLKRPTAMVVFPRETHELSRSGEPWHRIERLQHIVGWFDRYLLGVPHPEFDVRPGTQPAKTQSIPADR
jgi:hypothetical protein